jgi:peptidyl-prolyl cis-trans isomerase B (cyclophilin B)
VLLARDLLEPARPHPDGERGGAGAETRQPGALNHDPRVSRTTDRRRSARASHLFATGGPSKVQLRFRQGSDGRVAHKGGRHVAPSKKDPREARQARERLRAYQARQSVHERGRKRRTRDNIIAGIGVVIVLALAVGAQLYYFGSGPGKPVAKPSASASSTPTATPSATPTGANQGDVPSASIADNRTWTGTMTINKDIPLKFELDGKAAPQAVSSTISLIQKGFYDNTVCHRLATSAGFQILQCGDPHGNDPTLAGQGGPGYSYGPVENAPSDNVYQTGVLAMARSSDNAYSQGSQFFIVWGKSTIPSDSAGGYTVIGKITSGLDKLDTDVTSKGVAAGQDPQSGGTPKVTPTITSVTVK